LFSRSAVNTPYLLSLLLFLWLITALSPAFSQQTTEDRFALSVSEEKVTLQAQHAPLTAIMTELAEQLKIQVDVKLPEEEYVTVDFVSLPLEKAIKQISENSIVVSETDNAGISRIVLLPQGEGGDRLTSVTAVTVDEVITMDGDDNGGQVQSNPLAETSANAINADDAMPADASTAEETQETARAEDSGSGSFMFEFDPSEFAGK
jgi:hypothetical protein